MQTRPRVLAAGRLALTALALVFAAAQTAMAGEVEAKQILKAMSDYLAAQDKVAFDFDATLEVVTDQDQKLGIASSGTATLDRPDRIRTTRSNGFVDLESVFDGKTLTLLGKNANRYARIEISGTIDHLIDELRDTYGLPLPAADLLLSNPYDELMSTVIDVKDLGSGMIGGVECDWLAFRTEEVDWQIWIAQGDRPYPCRYVITTKTVADSPQYTIQVRDWRTGDQVATDDFAFHSPAGATEISVDEIRELADGLPQHFSRRSN